VKSSLFAHLGLHFHFFFVALCAAHPRPCQSLKLIIHDIHLIPRSLIASAFVLEIRLVANPLLAGIR